MNLQRRLFWAKFKAAANWAGVMESPAFCWAGGAWSILSSSSAPRDRANQPAWARLALELLPDCCCNIPGTVEIISLAARAIDGCFSTSAWTIFGSARCSISSQSWSIERATWSSARPGTFSMSNLTFSGLEAFWRIWRKLGLFIAERKA